MPPLQASRNDVFLDRVLSNSSLKQCDQPQCWQPCLWLAPMCVVPRVIGFAKRRRVLHELEPTMGSISRLSNTCLQHPAWSTWLSSRQRERKALTSDRPLCRLPPAKITANLERWRHRGLNCTMNCRSESDPQLGSYKTTWQSRSVYPRTRIAAVNRGALLCQLQQTTRL